ncbi:MAG: actin-like ATPase involved in cell division [Oscillospiraceae bacterium]|jgi:cell division protein FtsA|nr:actin-like ATPase involved in cell division [Oscillospiraceae bacterium]
MKDWSKTNTNLLSGINPDDLVFALDIGTRSIIGLVGLMRNDRFHIVAAEAVEHEKRAMIDGQIEDIDEVAAVAGRVKASLESQLGFTLHRVCVAAAGRALKTNTAEFSMTVSPKQAISKETVYELEMGAVSRASEALAEAEGDFEFYCVGYSVKRFYLDNYAYSTIIGHKGKEARVEVIATFLPSEVVDSLSAAMSKIELEIDFLTLEPIAAMNAVIPAELRLLNLALVDIGAGTSDIAICEEGSVTAYTMATVAGDEITEEIIRKYLVDFATAEGMKHLLSTDTDEIAYSDIIGFDYTVPRETLLESIGVAIDTLSKVISEKILQANTRSPAAVFLVGGGSKVPTLCALVADRLGIDQRKVAVGGNNFMKRVMTANQDLQGPEYATPLGIALTAAAAGENRGFSITLNGEKKQLFRSTVMPLMDVLLLCGYKYGDVLGKNGRSIEYELNGKRCVARGSYLQPAELRLNGEPASISSSVKSGDEIEVVLAQSGMDATLNIDQLAVLDENVAVYYHGSAVECGCVATINGRRAVPGQQIHNKDRIEVLTIKTLEDLIAHLGINEQDLVFLVNGLPRPKTYQLKNNDAIISSTAPAVEEQLPQEHSAKMPTLITNQPSIVTAATGSPLITATAPPADQPASGASDSNVATPLPMPVVEALEVTVNGTNRILPPKSDGGIYQFLDMLNLVDIDPTKPQGDIVLLHNGVSASYIEPISNGDKIDIYWAKRN